MAYTLTQARTLLTAAELNLFDHSRAAPIKALTPSRLRAKIVRARALRDKYRDLYRRQTVATRGAPARQRAPAGGDNARTEKKAVLFAEVLARFEARLAHLEAQSEQTSASAKAPSSKPSRSAKSCSSRASAAKPTAVAPASRTPRKASAKTATRARKIDLRAAVRQALDQQDATPHEAGPGYTRSVKAPSPRSPRSSASAPAKISAPLDTVARAERLNPLRQRADHIATHAHSGSQTRRAQGLRDSR